MIDEAEKLSALHIPLLMSLRSFLSTRDVAPKGLTSQQIFILLVLGETESVRIADVASSARVAHGTMVVAVQRLVRKGLVVKRRAADDRRAASLSLSKRGTEVWTAMNKRIVERYRDLLERLTSRERRQLADSVRTLVKFFNSSQGPAS